MAFADLLGLVDDGRDRGPALTELADATLSAGGARRRAAGWSPSSWIAGPELPACGSR